MKKILLCALPLFFLMAASTSCYTERIGCKNREVRLSAKHFKKSVNWCTTEAMRQSLVYFPPIEKDSSWSDIAKGRDTIILPGEKVEFDCDSFIVWRESQLNQPITQPKQNTKATIQCPQWGLIRDTARFFQKILQQDLRTINILKAEKEHLLAAKDAQIAKLQKQNAKLIDKNALQKGKLIIFYWAIGLGLGSAALWLAVKSMKIQIPFLG